MSTRIEITSKLHCGLKRRTLGALYSCISATAVLTVGESRELLNVMIEDVQVRPQYPGYQYAIPV